MNNIKADTGMRDSIADSPGNSKDKGEDANSDVNK